MVTSVKRFIHIKLILKIMTHSKFHIISHKRTATPEMKKGGNDSLYPTRYVFCLILLFLTISSRAVNMDSLSMKNYISSSTTTTYVAKNKMVSQDKYKQTRYWKKHKRLKACGWTTLGIGVPTMVVGFVGAVVSGYESGGDGEGFGIVICAGAGLTVSSIPLFVFAVKNRQKAIATALGTELDPQLWRKHRLFRIGACTALGIGLAGMATGLMGGAFDDSLYKNTQSWKAVFYTSVGITVASIPLFVLANTNKKRAKQAIEFSLSSSNIQMALPNGMLQTQPALGFCIHF